MGGEGAWPPVVLPPQLEKILEKTLYMYNRVWSRTVSRILSVSALAWPFGVITGKCVQAPAEDSVKKYILREAVYQRKFKAARKCIYLSH